MMPPQLRGIRKIKPGCSDDTGDNFDIEPI
jgi:hypothetical protein